MLRMSAIGSTPHSMRQGSPANGSTICAMHAPRLRLEQGEELAVVSRILGHASITTTANVYGHLTDAMLGRAAERTDVILARGAVAGA